MVSNHNPFYITLTLSVSNMYVYYINGGCAEREAQIHWSMVVPEKAAPVTGTTYWSCAGGLSAMNVIGTQLRDLMKLGTDPMAVGGINKWTPPRKSGGIP